MAMEVCPEQNALLSALPDSMLRRLLPDLEPVELTLGQVLKQQDDHFLHAWFPATAVVSLLNLTADGDSTAIAVIGHEGIVGHCLCMGDDFMPFRIVVQSAGSAFRTRAPAIVQAFAADEGHSALGLLLHYTQEMMTQIEQTAVCNRHHSVEQRLCRWILMNLDRLSGNDMFITQELVASMLGVRREAVSDAAAAMQRAGFIRYARGHIRVLDREAIEKRVCECYGVVRIECDRLERLPVST